MISAFPDLGPAAQFALEWLPYTSAHCLIGLNFVFRSAFPNDAVRLRAAYLLTSCSLVLAGGPWLIPPSCRSISVQLAGALLAGCMRAYEYAFLVQLPAELTTLQILARAVQDTFLPFGAVSTVSNADDLQKPAATTGRPSGGDGAPVDRRSTQRDSAPARRQPLAVPGTPPWAARLDLLQQALLQYLVYDLALSVAVKARGVAVPAAGLVTALHPSWSAAGLAQSCGFAVALYLHFAIWHKLLVVAASFVMPELLTQLGHQFARPWAMDSVADLWSRWHQLFRTSFLRLAHRPTKAWLRNSVRPWLKDDAVGSSARGVAAALLLPLLPLLEQALPLLAVFLLSGLVHEYMCWAAFGRTSGHQLAFFLLHGAAAVAEAVLHRAVPWLHTAAAGRALWRAASLAFAVATSVIFMKPWLLAGYHQDFWHPVRVFAGLAGHGAQLLRSAS